MKKKLFVVLSALVVMLFALGVTACNSNDDDPNDGTSSTWTFQNSAYGHTKIEMTINNDGSPSSFTFYPGDEMNVTWRDKGSNYRGGYSYTSYKSSSYSGSGVYVKYYDAIKVVQFLDY